MFTRPMLSPRQDPMSHPTFFEELRYPLLCSPKFDGVRGVVAAETVMSRTFKPLPSLQVQEMFGQERYEGFDGEVIAGNPNDFGVYNRTQSHVMSKDKPCDELTFHVFDNTSEDTFHLPFYERLESLDHLHVHYNNPGVFKVHHQNVENYAELLDFENQALEAGFEGIMMRDPIGPYKCGRGTFKEGYIYKLKRFEDAEAVILDIVEGSTNLNIPTKNALGYTERSTHKLNLVPSGMAKGFVVELDGQVLEVAPGNFTHSERVDVLVNKHNFIGSLLKFRFMRHGMKDKPRHPRAIGFRNLMDM